MDTKKQMMLAKGLVIGILVVIGFLAGTLYDGKSSKIEVQSVPQPPKRFQLQADEIIGSIYLRVICDSETGTLIYGSSSGLTVVPNGCAKTSPK